MGFFDFFKDAGENDLTAKAEISEDRVNAIRQEHIEKNIAQLDIEGEVVSVSVAGDVATLRGTAPSQEAMEKMVLCAGNQHGIGQVDCQVEVDAPPAPAAPEPAPAAAAEAPAAEPSPAPAAPEATFYTVVSGDTLGKIAKEHYGDAGKYPVIFEANKPMLKDPDKIYPGQTLRIPAL
ncbi:MAG: LysM and BON domain-containing protein [Halioglobus sp.]